MSQRKHLTRRSFLKGATAAAAVPYFVPSSVLGRGGFYRELYELQGREQDEEAIGHRLSAVGH